MERPDPRHPPGALPAAQARSPEEARRILRDRAKALAAPIEESTAGGAVVEVVEFMLGEEAYGIECTYVREVVPLRNLTPLPCTPSFVLGITNVRGEICSVVDLRDFFDLPGKGSTDGSVIFIIESPDMEFGIVANSIVGTRRIAMDDVRTSLPTLTAMRARYLKGVTKDALTILDGSRLLADPNLVVHEEVADA